MERFFSGNSSKLFSVIGPQRRTKNIVWQHLQMHFPSTLSTCALNRSAHPEKWLACGIIRTPFSNVPRVKFCTYWKCSDDSTWQMSALARSAFAPRKADPTLFKGKFRITAMLVFRSIGIVSAWHCCCQRSKKRKDDKLKQTFLIKVFQIYR